jgi:hypothetical protein
MLTFDAVRMTEAPSTSSGRAASQIGYQDVDAAISALHLAIEPAQIGQVCRIGLYGQCVGTHGIPSLFPVRPDGGP